MATWTDKELNSVGNAEELRLAALRNDGTLRPYVTIWVVRAGDELYVRSAYGPENPATGRPSSDPSSGTTPFR
jgi:hypothetical protein